LAAEFIIKEFPNDDQFWRVDGIGKVSRNPYVDSEPRVQVLLSALINNYGDPLKNKNITRETKHPLIGIGQLPLISIGSVWRRKEQVSIIGGSGDGGAVSVFEIDTLSTESLTGEINSWKGVMYINDTVVGCIPREYYKVGQNYKYLADSPLWAFRVNHHRCAAVLIPPYEILRSYYLSSNKVARAIFEDDIGLLIDKKESEVLDDGNVYLSLLKTTDDSDAWFIARWLASEKTRNQIKELNRTIVTASANATPRSDTNEIGTYINIGFPFEGVTKIRAAGKFMKLHPDIDQEAGEKEIWGFLVLNIQSCTHPMPFKDVACDRKNNSTQGENRDDPTLPATAFQLPPANQQYPNIPLNLASDEEPSKSHRALLQAMFKGRFTDLTDKELIHNPKLIQKYKSARKNVVVPPKEFSQHGTGEGTSGETSTGMVNVKQQLMPLRDKLPADLTTFIGAIKHVRTVKQKDRWTVTTIEVSGRGQEIDGKEVISCFPSRIKGCVSWHLMSQAPDIPRALVVAKVASPVGISYIMEMERKKDMHCVLVLYAKDHAPIDDKTMDIFLATTAKKNGWPPEYILPHLKRIRVHHNEKRTIENFAKAILKKMDEAN